MKVPPMCHCKLNTNTVSCPRCGLEPRHVVISIARLKVEQSVRSDES